MSLTQNFCFAKNSIDICPQGIPGLDAPCPLGTDGFPIPGCQYEIPNKVLLLWLHELICLNNIPIPSGLFVLLELLLPISSYNGSENTFQNMSIIIIDVHN